MTPHEITQRAHRVDVILDSDRLRNKDVTLLEARLRESVDQVEKTNGKPGATPAPF